MKIVLIVLLALAGLVIAGAIVAGPQLQMKLSGFGSTPQGTKVRLETASKGELIETIKAPGLIEPHTKVDISAEVAARIEDLPFREGQQVKKGDVVVKLDDRDLKAALSAAKARLDGEKARLQAENSTLVGLSSSLKFARTQLERDQRLFASGDLSQKGLDESLQRVQDLEAQVDATKFTLSNIESSLASASAEIDRAQDSLSKTVIKAPMDGVITILNAEIGEVVLMGTMNNAGTVIMTIADLSRMILKAEVAESDISRVAEGQAARVYINAYRDQVFSGRVTQVALQRTVKLTDNTGYFEAEVEIDTGGRIVRSGCQANVDIEIQTHQGLLVESQAVVDRLVDDLPDEIKRDNPLVDRKKKTTTVVYRVENDKAVCTPVRRGPSDDTRSLVLDGLKAGDKVIIGPFKVLESLKHQDAVVDEAVAAAATQNASQNSNQKASTSSSPAASTPAASSDPPAASRPAA